MNSPTCPKCDCVKGCQSNPSPCPILLAECIASGQVSAAQIEAHRVLDAAIAQPEQPAEPVAWMTIGYMGEPIIQRHPSQYANQVTPLYDHPAPVRQPLTIQEVEQILAQHNYELHGDRARYIVKMTEAAHGITTPKETT